VSWHQTQAALQWWEGRRTLRLDQQAEYIREGLLQELFTMRRCLELSETPDPSHTQHQHWLSQVEKLHQSLEQLGYQLSPPYSEESLPLALQHLLQQWQRRPPTCKIELDLPLQWQEQRSESNRLVITALDELLQLVLPQDAVGLSAQICLRTQGHRAELALQVMYPDPTLRSQVCRARELRYLERAFEVLAAGRCFQQQRGATASWRLSWPLH
jgi:hypothetical protein